MFFLLCPHTPWPINIAVMFCTMLTIWPRKHPHTEFCSLMAGGTIPVGPHSQTNFCLELPTSLSSEVCKVLEVWIILTSIKLIRQIYMALAM